MGRSERNPCALVPGRHITPQMRDRIIHHLENADFPTKTQTARACQVSVETVNNIMKKFPEVKRKFQEALTRKIEEVEQAGFDLAINGEHPIAKEKMIEFMLTHHKPDTYSDSAATKKAVGEMPKIIIPIKIERSSAVVTVQDIIASGKIPSVRDNDEADMAATSSKKGVEVIDV